MQTFFLPTFLCYLCQWPKASRAENNRWGTKRCPPGWGYLSPQSYCQHGEGHMNLYLKNTDVSLTMCHHKTKYKIQEKGEKAGLTVQLHASYKLHCRYKSTSLQYIHKYSSLIIRWLTVILMEKLQIIISLSLYIHFFLLFIYLFFD